MSDTENNDATHGQYANLKPWKPGQSGNPGGRPKAHAALRQKCRDLDEENIKRLQEIAKNGDTDAASVAAIKLLLAYGHGAPPAKPLDEDDETAAESQGALTDEQVRALARAKLGREH